MATSPVNLPEGYQLDQPGVPEGYTVDTPTSAAGAAGLGAVDAIPFGMKGLAKGEEALKGGKYDDYLKELDTLLAQQKEEHPIAHVAGELAGSVAPFAIPGVGEALGAESLAGRAGIGAGLGALQGASNTRNPLSSPAGVQDIAKGAGTGAVLNPALGAVGDFLSGQANKLAPKLEEFANTKTVQSLGISPGKMGVPSEDIQNMGNFAHELGADKGSLESRYNVLHDALQQTGKQIEDLGAGKTLTDTQPFVDELHQHLQDSNSVYGLGTNPEATLYRQGIANLQNPDGISFDTLQSVKNAVADRAFDSNGNIKDQAAFNVYKTYSTAMEKLASEHSEYPDLKKAYSVLKDMTQGIEGQFQKEQASGIQARGFGMAGKMAGMVTGGNPTATGLASAGLMAAGHPMMGIGAATTLMTNPEAMATGARGAAGMLSKLGSSGIPTAPMTNALTNASHTKIPPQYAPVFQKATQGLTDPAEKQKQTTITDFVLQSRDPNYAKAKKEVDF